MLKINIENRAITKLNFSLMKNIDGAIYYDAILYHMN